MATQRSNGKAGRLQALSAFVRVKPFIVIAAEDVRLILEARGLPPHVRDNLAHLRSDLLYAVRSSAKGEDSAAHSWAGQFKTLLDVKTANLESAIIECAEAITSTNVAAYGAARGVDPGSLDLIVQEMVDAKCAGVLFTRDPVGSEGLMVIEAVRGNAEKLVNSHVESTRYYIDPATGETKRSHIVDGFQLTDRERQELYLAALKIREAFGGEEDIEWAFETKTHDLYINQARPITGIDAALDDIALRVGNLNAALRAETVRLNALGAKFGEDVLSDQNIVEILGDTPTRMTHGLFCYLFAHGEGAIKTGRNSMGYEIGDELNAGFQLLVAGKPRASIVHDAFTYRIAGIPLQDYCRIVESYLCKIKTDATFANYPEVGLYEQNPSEEFLTRIFDPKHARRYGRAYATFFKRIRALEATRASECRLNFVPQWQRVIDAHLNEKPDSVDAHVGLYRRMCDELRTIACPMFVQIARLGFFAFARAHKALLEKFGKEEADAYLSDLMGVRDPESPNLRFSNMLLAARRGDLSVEAVIAEFGHLAEHELEISLPRYRNRSDLIEALVANAREPETKANFRRALEAYSRLESVFGETWSSVWSDVLYAREYLMLREVVKFHYLKGYEVARGHAIEIGRMLGWEDGLIFHLDPIEVFQLPAEAARMHDVAVLARSEHAQNAEIYVPQILYTDDLRAIGVPPANGDRALRGIGVTSYSTEGICIVVVDLSDAAVIAQIQEGSILVTKKTDPAWSPVIEAVGKTGGIVTKVGGILAHTAICAREQGIAGVVNLGDAIKHLKTGMRVRVDGRAGIVEILSDD
ncbi:hypothetical protein HY970_01740 [Candidatus Kaiserbacteria bacterium]|nr:hypothetical protein [Candidatus Kaiserbacteria bacterium]